MLGSTPPPTAADFSKVINVIDFMAGDKSGKAAVALIRKELGSFEAERDALKKAQAEHNAKVKAHGEAVASMNAQKAEMNRRSESLTKAEGYAGDAEQFRRALQSRMDAAANNVAGAEAASKKTIAETKAQLESATKQLELEHVDRRSKIESETDGYESRRGAAEAAAKSAEAVLAGLRQKIA